MKTILISTLAAAAVALSASSAFAMSNSPQGRIVIGGDDPSYDGGYASTPEGRFLSGRVYYGDDGYYDGGYGRMPAGTYYRGPVVRGDGYMYREDDE